MRRPAGVSAFLVALGGCSIVSGLDDFRPISGSTGGGGSTATAGGGGTGAGSEGGSGGGEGGQGGTACDNHVLLFDGEDDLVRVDAFDAFHFSEFTVELWFRLEAPPGEPERRLVSYEMHDQRGYSLSFASFPASNPGRVFYRVYDFFIHQTFSTEVPAQDEWRHVAGVFDGAEMRLYLDGEEVGSSQAAISHYTGDFNIGASSGGAFNFQGAIDEVRLSSVVRYTVPFTPSRRFELDGDTEGLWHFDDADGLIASDEVGAHDGELQGSSGQGTGPAWRLECF